MSLLSYVCLQEGAAKAAAASAAAEAAALGLETPNGSVPTQQEREAKGAAQQRSAEVRCI